MAISQQELNRCCDLELTLQPTLVCLSVKCWVGAYQRSLPGQKFQDFTHFWNQLMISLYTTSMGGHHIKSPCTTCHSFSHCLSINAVALVTAIISPWLLKFKVFPSFDFNSPRPSIFLDEWELSEEMLILT